MSRRSGPLDEQPCRQCTSFKDFLKGGFNNKSEGEDPAIGFLPVRDDCPLDKDELGNKTWGLLHTMAAKYPDKPTCEQKVDMKNFFRIFSKFYPCEHCAADLREELTSNPPKVESQADFSQWLCDLHNKINVKLGKEKFDCSKVNERWRDGWLDGSCDYLPPS
ncbi:FAD-linked sulfhydryl oxidase ALR isoform X2 [Agrilus planipennis]|uniref:Sulfhydryl oxidase n=1 Tax=Agrilus planipennis TaxID=224129 RepID=A0A1W4X277_AGRPL|nr:FAD-linked sulfhydryl oxidase ALR isoform X2 [Agrilus planipennis]